MKRRKFITLLGGAAVAWPLGADAQQPQDRSRRIAIMMAPAEDDPEGQARVTGFRQKLEELGWIEGTNLQIDYRWDAGPDRSTSYAAELVRLAPDCGQWKPRLVRVTSSDTYDPSHFCRGC